MQIFADALYKTTQLLRCNGESKHSKLGDKNGFFNDNTNSLTVISFREMSLILVRMLSSIVCDISFWRLHGWISYIAELSCCTYISVYQHQLSLHTKKAIVHSTILWCNLRSFALWAPSDAYGNNISIWIGSRFLSSIYHWTDVSRLNNRLEMELGIEYTQTRQHTPTCTVSTIIYL